MKAEKQQTKGFFWHIHHDKLVEWSDDINKRVEYIKKDKPASEQEIRLGLMKKVKGVLPAEFVRAYKARDKAWVKVWVKADKAGAKADKARDKADKAWDKACKARDKADKVWVKAYKAGAKADKAWTAYMKACDKADKARDKADKALDTCKAEIEALHKKECGCSEWNGKEIVFKKMSVESKIRKARS